MLKEETHQEDYSKSSAQLLEQTLNVDILTLIIRFIKVFQQCSTLLDATVGMDLSVLVITHMLQAEKFLMVGIT